MIYYSEDKEVEENILNLHLVIIKLVICNFITD